MKYSRRLGSLIEWVNVRTRIEVCTENNQMEITFFNKSITMQLFCHFLERLPCTSWRRLLEQTGQLMGLFCKIPLLTLGRLTREYSLSSIYFIRRVKSSEILVVHSALYLKECGVVLMWYLSQSTSPLDPGAPYVATSRSGIPPAFFVPPHYRKLLRNRDKRAMQWW